jgi:glycosyltransferase involved in cell wall biosynthesis
MLRVAAVTEREGGNAVLIVTDAYPPACGGSGWSTHALVVALRGGERQVHVIEVDGGADGGVARRRHEDVDVVTLPLGKHRGPSRHLRVEDYSLAPVRDFVGAFLAEHPDIGVVHGQHLHSGPGAALAARDANRAAVVTLRDYWPVRLDGIAYATDADRSEDELARIALERSFGVSGLAAGLGASRALRRLGTRQAGLNACDRVICVSDAVRRHVSGALTPPIEVIPNLIDPTATAAAAARGEKAPPAEPYLFAAGKLNPMKGFDTLVDDLAGAGCALPVVVAGTGPLEAAMAERAAEAGVDLRLVGWLDGDSLLRHVRDAHAVVLPSAWEEPLARVILETQALGRPLIARPTGGTPEAIQPGVNGFLYESPAELRAALDALADDSTRERVGTAARTWCNEHYATDVVLGRVLECYERAGARHG